MITPTASFKENLQLLASVDDVQRIDLADQSGVVVSTIPNEAGKQGSLVVYQYLHDSFGALDAKAAALFDIVDGGAALEIRIVAA